MKRSVETSKLLQHRAKEVVPDRIRQMRQVSTLGVKIRNLKVDFKTGGTWRRVGQ